jgi:hypothetical protein
MSERQTFILAHMQARQRAAAAVAIAPDNWRVEIKEPKRTDGQNDRFHAICNDIVRSGLQWAGKRRTTAQWKVLLVSGHATATKEGAEMVPGLEGEFVNIRESTALMSVRRGSSLIEYSTAFAVSNGVTLNDPALVEPPHWAAQEAARWSA